MSTRPAQGSDELRQYRKKKGNEVVAVKLDLDTDGFTYEKWGGTQSCKQGDWIVYNKGDTYTVDAATFANTYREVGPGLYLKTTPVWAKRADTAGSVRTKEGVTHYEQGDFIVYNDASGGDCYAVSGEKFAELYEAVE